ncbi:hypothetical protein ECDEC10A_2681 [Escherichia coli DEC10A]|nr:hypothetical protein ECDEC10A_2681 [Escherichia coli DEC10A]
MGRPAFGFLIPGDYRREWRHSYSILRAIMRGETRKMPGMGKVIAASC